MPHARRACSHANTKCLRRRASTSAAPGRGNPIFCIYCRVPLLRTPCASGRSTQVSPDDPPPPLCRYTAIDAPLPSTPRVDSVHGSSLTAATAAATTTTTVARCYRIRSCTKYQDLSVNTLVLYVWKLGFSYLCGPFVFFGQTGTYIYSGSCSRPGPLLLNLVYDYYGIIAFLARNKTRLASRSGHVFANTHALMRCGLFVFAAPAAAATVVGVADPGPTRAGTVFLRRLGDGGGPQSPRGRRRGR